MISIEELEENTDSVLCDVCGIELVEGSCKVCDREIKNINRPRKERKVRVKDKEKKDSVIENTASKYRDIRQLIIDSKKNWGNTVYSEKLYRQYLPLVLVISKKISKMNVVEMDINRVVQDTKSFFLELLWEYNTDSCVQFTRYLQRKLYFRVKNFYEKQINTNSVSFEECGLSLCQSLFKHTDIIANNDVWRNVLSSFPEESINFLLCTEYLKLRQEDVGKIFGVVQPVVSNMRKDIMLKLAEYFKEQVVNAKQYN